MRLLRQDTYGPWLRKELGELIDGLDLSDLRKRSLRSRWLDQVIWLEGKSKKNQRPYYWLRALTISAGVVVPALVGLGVRHESVSSAIAWVTFALSLVVALAAALEGFFRPGERWRNYRRSAELLKSAGWQFFQLAGPYSAFESHAAAYTAFADQVEALIKQDVEVYMTRVAADDKKADGHGTQ